MQSRAVVLEKPGQIVLADLAIAAPTVADVVVDVEFSGISTGTEKLLWSGRMPDFPGMGYPLVPGYESAGIIVEAGSQSGRKSGERVFVPGANCFGEVRGLFGGAASRLVVPGARVQPVDATLGDRAVLLALAATAYHAASPDTRKSPQLIVGHGVLGRLIARIVLATGGEPPLVWETNEQRHSGSDGYSVVAPDADARRNYDRILDVSGDSSIVDQLCMRLAHGGEIVLAGFYDQRVSFSFPPAFMREARIRVAAEWKRNDLVAVTELIASGKLSLDGLITHSSTPGDVDRAYRTAFDDPSCLKMILDWRSPT